jgi:hypothetical protein
MSVITASLVVAFGRTHSNIVTAHGGLLFAPPVFLLAGLDLAESAGHRQSDGLRAAGLGDEARRIANHTHNYFISG